MLNYLARESCGMLIAYKGFLLLHFVRSLVHTHDKHDVRNRKYTLRGLHEYVLITHHRKPP